ncbi:hypothetical protein TNCV_595161 [Trichonephila clavipes]|nr:hypothetical protein TNCV_595161 [Trichonephila clavipes]
MEEVPWCTTDQHYAFPDKDSFAIKSVGFLLSRKDAGEFHIISTCRFDENYSAKGIQTHHLREHAPIFVVATTDASGFTITILFSSDQSNGHTRQMTGVTATLC